MLELLVAGTITIILAGIIVGIVSNVLTTANRATGSLLSGNQAKLALDYLAQDLQSAVMRRDNNVWLVATIQPDQVGKGDSSADWGEWDPVANGMVKPDATGGSLALAPDSRPTASCRFGMAGMWLRLLAPDPDINTYPNRLSTVRAISYQIVRAQFKTEGAMRYCLFRSVVDSDTTFAVGYDLLATAYNEPDGIEGHAGNVRTAPKQRLLSNNVIDFGVRFYRRDSSTGVAELLFPLADDPRDFAATELPLATTILGYPDFAEVFLRVLTDEGAQQIENLEAGRLGAIPVGVPAEYANDSEWWWAVAEANSEVYTRRIEIKGRPL